MATPDDEREITQVIGSLFLRYPEVAQRVSYDELRRLAAETRAAALHRIPEAFLRAFAEPEA